MKVHPVFHVDLLERFHPDPIPGRSPKPLPPVVVDGEEEFIVESVLDSRLFKGQLQYFVHWKNYPVSERTWEPAQNLTNAADLVKEFHDHHPRKPRPLPRGAQP